MSIAHVGFVCQPCQRLCRPLQFMSIIHVSFAALSFSACWLYHSHWLRVSTMSAALPPPTIYEYHSCRLRRPLFFSVLASSASFELCSWLLASSLALWCNFLETWTFHQAIDNQH